jgi:hypothetical protein
VFLWNQYALTRQSVNRLPTTPRTMNKNATAAGELVTAAAAPITPSETQTLTQDPIGLHRIRLLS